MLTFILINGRCPRSALQAERAEIAAAHAKAADRVDSLSAKLSGLQFSFSDPVKGFDRSKVSLMRLKACDRSARQMIADRV